jgi:hypothetical protein
MPQVQQPEGLASCRRNTNRNGLITNYVGARAYRVQWPPDVVTECSEAALGAWEPWVGEETQIPPQVRELLIEKVRSIEELEILLWFRLNPRPAMAVEIARELKLAATTTADALLRLVGNQLLDVQLTADGAGLFAPLSQAASVVDALAQTYEDFRVEMLVLISSSAIRRVRRGALETFSEAFRLRWDKKDG